MNKKFLIENLMLNNSCLIEKKDLYANSVFVPVEKKTINYNSKKVLNKFLLKNNKLNFLRLADRNVIKNKIFKNLFLKLKKKKKITLKLFNKKRKKNLKRFKNLKVIINKNFRNKVFCKKLKKNNKIQLRSKIKGRVIYANRILKGSVGLRKFLIKSFFGNMKTTINRKLLLKLNKVLCNSSLIYSFKNLFLNNKLRLTSFYLKIIYINFLKKLIYSSKIKFIKNYNKLFLDKKKGHNYFYNKLWFKKTLLLFSKALETKYKYKRELGITNFVKKVKVLKKKKYLNNFLKKKKIFKSNFPKNKLNFIHFLFNKKYKVKRNFLQKSRLSKRTTLDHLKSLFLLKKSKLNSKKDIRYLLKKQMKIVYTKAKFYFLSKANKRYFKLSSKLKKKKIKKFNLKFINYNKKKSLFLFKNKLFLASIFGLKLSSKVSLDKFNFNFLYNSSKIFLSYDHSSLKKTILINFIVKKLLLLVHKRKLRLKYFYVKNSSTLKTKMTGLLKKRNNMVFGLKNNTLNSLSFLKTSVIKRYYSYNNNQTFLKKKKSKLNYNLKKKNTLSKTSRVSDKKFSDNLFLTFPYFKKNYMLMKKKKRKSLKMGLSFKPKFLLSKFYLKKLKVYFKKTMVIVGRKAPKVRKKKIIISKKKLLNMVYVSLKKTNSNFNNNNYKSFLKFLLLSKGSIFFNLSLNFVEKKINKLKKINELKYSNNLVFFNNLKNKELLSNMVFKNNNLQLNRLNMRYRLSDNRATKKN